MKNRRDQAVEKFSEHCGFVQDDRAASIELFTMGYDQAVSDVLLALNGEVGMEITDRMYELKGVLPARHEYVAELGEMFGMFEND
jgi:hypothetical protein